MGRAHPGRCPPRLLCETTWPDKKQGPLFGTCSERVFQGFGKVRNGSARASGNETRTRPASAIRAGYPLERAPATICLPHRGSGRIWRSRIPMENPRTTPWLRCIGQSDSRKIDNVIRQR
jgi:hypothetical protein